MTRLLPAAFAALFAVQILPTLAAAWRHTRRLETGRPVVLAVTTRDPRDLLRGEYSVLAYEIGQVRDLPVPDVPADCADEGRVSCALRGGRTVYVRLAPDAGGVHRAVEARFAPPAEAGPFIAGRLTGGRVVRAGMPDRGGPCAASACLTGRVAYGIERWYGAQGAPAELDRAARADLRVEVRLAPDGTAALDGIAVAGTRFARTARLW